MESGESSTSESSQPEKDSSAIEKKVDEKLASILSQPSETEIVETAKSPERPEGRGEVSAAAVARMMGLATASEVSILEGKLDLLSSRVNSFTVKMEKVLSTLNRLPTGSDLDRIDVTVGSLKTMIRETLEKLYDATDSPQGESKLKNTKILSNEEDEA